MFSLHIRVPMEISGNSKAVIIDFSLQNKGLNFESKMIIIINSLWVWKSLAFSHVRQLEFITHLSDPATCVHYTLPHNKLKAEIFAFRKPMINRIWIKKELKFIDQIIQSIVRKALSSNNFRCLIWYSIIQLYPMDWVLQRNQRHYIKHIYTYIYYWTVI